MLTIKQFQDHAKAEFYNQRGPKFDVHMLLAREFSMHQCNHCRGGRGATTETENSQANVSNFQS